MKKAIDIWFVILLSAVKQHVTYILKLTFFKIDDNVALICYLEVYMIVTIVGAGLAGSEAALQLASKNIEVNIIDSKPNMINPSVYKMDSAGELVCSNSLKSETDTSSFLLKSEMRLSGSYLLAFAQECKVPAGASLAVNRNLFSQMIESALEKSELINYIKGVNISSIQMLKKEYPADYYIVATGPLTENRLMDSISTKNSYFYDAIAPQVSIESLNLDKMFWGSRYDKGDPDFLNIPLTHEQYNNFIDALLASEKLPYNEMENPKFFERCMPIEELASRGHKTISFGPMRPVGFTIEGKRPAAVLQLRTENKDKTAFNLVGCQTRMRQAAQKKVFSTLPGMENADFIRYGSVHRNSFIKVETFY